MEQFVVFQKDAPLLLTKSLMLDYLKEHCFDEDETLRVLSLKKGQVNEVYCLDDDGFMLKLTIGFLG